MESIIRGSELGKVDILNGACFVILNTLDGWLTTELSAIGGVELNKMFLLYVPVSAGAPDIAIVVTKALLAAVIVAALVLFGKGKLLWLLNGGMALVVLVNAVSFLAYWAGFFSWL